MNFIQIHSESAILHILTHRPERIKSLAFYQSAHSKKHRLADIESKARALQIPCRHEGKEKVAGEPEVVMVVIISECAGLRVAQRAGSRDRG